MKFHSFGSNTVSFFANLLLFLLFDIGTGIRCESRAHQFVIIICCVCVRLPRKLCHLNRIARRYLAPFLETNRMESLWWIGHLTVVARCISDLMTLFVRLRRRYKSKTNVTIAQPSAHHNFERPQIATPTDIVVDGTPKNEVTQKTSRNEHYFSSSLDSFSC